MERNGENRLKINENVQFEAYYREQYNSSCIR